MPLLPVKLTPYPGPLPPEVRRFLAEADRRIAEFQQSSRVPGFVPSDFAGVYRHLRALSESNLAPGSRLCEWGSGFGVVASLAAGLDFDAIGIEIDGSLVEEAERLAADFDWPAEFIQGSFIPTRAQGFLERAYARTGGGFSWLTTESDDRLEWDGHDPADFDVIFAYPWPDEEGLLFGLFDRCAAEGALLLTHHAGDGFRLHRKVRKPKSRG